MEVSLSPKVFLFAALPCEAKPLIDAYKLKKDTSIQPFSIFRKDDMVLTVTGIGKTAMAAGVAYTHAYFPQDHYSICLNIGIAGHQDHSVGSLFLADKITDADMGRSYYPPLIFTPPCPTAHLITFAKPQETYTGLALCDMEASAFYETAARFSTGEFCQCIKIVSDNADCPAIQIQTQTVSNLIYSNLPAIKQIVAELTSLSNRLPTDSDNHLFEGIAERYHFSLSEQIQLAKCLNRWRVINGQTEFDPDAISVKTGKEFIEALTRELDATEFTL